MFTQTSHTFPGFIKSIVFDTIQDEAIEADMIRHMVRLMRNNDAPFDQYERMGLTEEYHRQEAEE